MIFTLLQEHLDLLAASEFSMCGGDWLAVELTELAARSQCDCHIALQIILSARGSAVPPGRYECVDGRWTKKEEVT